jgi:hypothetical protein
MKIFFVPQNRYDGIPFGSKPFEMDIIDIADTHKFFNTPIEEELSSNVKGYTHMIYEGNALYYNDSMRKILENYIPEHWSFDQGGIMGNAILFNKNAPDFQLS